jgi:hypothetical protein
MDVDEQAKVPKKTVDLGSIIFSQGGQLMSNKTTKLSEGSFKRAKKGYEEIHVPRPNRSLSQQVNLYQSPTCQNERSRVSQDLKLLIACRASLIR